MILKTENEIIEGILKKCAENPDRHYELRYLISIYVEGEKDSTDIYKRRLSIAKIIDDGCLLTQYPSGYTANAKTREIINAGGYIKYISRQQKKNELQEEADEARNRTAILQWKRINWAFGFSITAILIALASFVVTICK